MHLSARWNEAKSFMGEGVTHAFVIGGCRVGGCSLQSVTSVTGRVQGGGTCRAMLEEERGSNPFSTADRT